MNGPDRCSMTSGASPGAAHTTLRGALDLPPAGLAVVHAAVIHAADGVRCLVVGASPETVTARLAEYVRRQAADRLWPSDSRRVERMLARRMLDAAVGEYFAHVGARWDEEYLYRGTTELPSEVPPSPRQAPTTTASR